MTFTAPGAGVLFVSGGAISALLMTRGRVSLPLPVGPAVLPLGNGDQVSITYTGATKATFLPS